MLELLITSILLLSGGYATRWYTEPECRTIVHTVPEMYIEQLGVRDCKEEGNAQCPIETPRWVIPSEEYSKMSGYIKGLRLHYMECDRLIQIYNENKTKE